MRWVPKPFARRSANATNNSRHDPEGFGCPPLRCGYSCAGSGAICERSIALHRRSCAALQTNSHLELIRSSSEQLVRTRRWSDSLLALDATSQYNYFDIQQIRCMRGSARDDSTMGTDLVRRPGLLGSRCAGDGPTGLGEMARGRRQIRRCRPFRRVRPSRRTEGIHSRIRAHNAAGPTVTGIIGISDRLA